MANDRNEVIRKLFNEALKRKGSKREAFLSEACSGDASLREEVESLLAVYEEAPEFLEKPGTSRPDQGAAKSEGVPPDMEKEPGLPFERLGEFRALRKLGEGGMGVVYLAVQESLNRQVALKVIRPEWIGSPEAEIRFSREVQAVAELRHPNIVTVFGSGEEKGIHFFAMELVLGKSLDEILCEANSREEKIPLPEVLGWIQEIAQALDCAHRSGIIHRDVKPSNIRITTEGQAMLMDFSVARHSKLFALTRTGEFRGTPYYASPEQIKARRLEIDARTDVYSLGVTLFEAVTGRVPFDGETTEQVFRQILESDPVPPRRLNPAVSRDLETVIATAMDKDPARRYQTMAEFSRELERLRAGEPVMARPAGWIRKSSKWIKRHRFSSLAAVSALLLLAVVLTLVSIVSRQKQEQLDIAMERYRPMKEALEWPDFLTYSNPWRWCLDADPRDPSAYMLQAVFDIGSGALADAEANLEECIEKCLERSEDILEKDAWYLLGLVRFGLAEKYSGFPQNKKELIEGAESALMNAGELDPASRDAFVLRKPNLSTTASDQLTRDIRNIQLNTENYLVQMYLGLSVFHNLYKGGGKGEFEKAIGHFQNTLKTRPDNIMALAFLGRTYYFFARFYNFLDLTGKAEEYLKHALAISEQPYHMIYTTLGQNWLLRGDHEKALKAFNKAVEAGKEMYHIHNALSGMGQVLVGKGRFEEALEKYREAMAREKSDVHTKVAMAELLLLQGDIDKALEVLNEILEFFSQTPQSNIAVVYLVCARAHLKQKAYPEAITDLEKIDRLAIHSPRDLSVACLVMATFPDEWQYRLVSLATKFANKASYNARFDDRNSPICLSALGAAAFLSNEHQSAIDHFLDAISERERWPQEVRKYYWTEDVRDQYFLAMAHFRLARDQGGGKADESAAQRFFTQAEEEFVKRDPPLATADVLNRIRDKAREVQGLLRR
jgi:serine/threonine protein kinase/Tfp pilus assembly protein PilF